MKKYELVASDTVILYGTTLYRIRALRDFGNVKTGDLGGYVQSEANLSHYGMCWVYGNAHVYDNARVSENARVFGNAHVLGNARVNGNKCVFRKACVIEDEPAKDEKIKETNYESIKGVTLTASFSLEVLEETLSLIRKRGNGQFLEGLHSLLNSPNHWPEIMAELNKCSLLLKNETLMCIKYIVLGYEVKIKEYSNMLIEADREAGKMP